MSSLVNIAAILVFAFFVFAAVAVALRFLIPSEPNRVGSAERSRGPRRVLADLISLLAAMALVFLASEVRIAYGAPFGERGDPVEVVEVGECERAPIGFGIARTCEVAAYRYVDAEDDPTPWAESIEVVTGEPVRPGDRVARYSSSGWTAFLFLGSSGSRWQPVSAEDRLNLVWLPTATLIAAMALSTALRNRYRRRVAGGTRVGS